MLFCIIFLNTHLGFFLLPGVQALAGTPKFVASITVQGIVVNYVLTFPNKVNKFKALIMEENHT